MKLEICAYQYSQWVPPYHLQHHNQNYKAFLIYDPNSVTDFDVPECYLTHGNQWSLSIYTLLDGPNTISKGDMS